MGKKSTKENKKKRTLSHVEKEIEKSQEQRAKRRKELEFLIKGEEQLQQALKKDINKLKDKSTKKARKELEEKKEKIKQARKRRKEHKKELKKLKPEKK